MLRRPCETQTRLFCLPSGPSLWTNPTFRNGQANPTPTPRQPCPVFAKHPIEGSSPPKPTRDPQAPNMLHARVLFCLGKTVSTLVTTRRVASTCVDMRRRDWAPTPLAPVVDGLRLEPQAPELQATLPWELYTKPWKVLVDSAQLDTRLLTPTNASCAKNNSNSMCSSDLLACRSVAAHQLESLEQLETLFWPPLKEGRIWLFQPIFTSVCGRWGKGSGETDSKNHGNPERQ